MSAQDKLNYYISQIDKELAKYPTLVNLERQTSVPKAYGVLGVGAIFIVLVFFNIFAGFLTNVVGVLFPVYFSMRALETPQSQDDVQWLTYWSVFGVFQLLEAFVDVILYWFPFYYTFKLLVILYLVLPQTRGAINVYQKVLRPVLAQHFASTTTTAAPQTAAHTQ